MSETLNENQALEILLVEDNPDHAELSLHALGMAVRNRVQVVEDGEEALDYLMHRGRYTDAQAHPLPGLILLDLRLPKLDGIEVLRRIRSEPELCSIPICMLTTSADTADIASCYAAGANSYVTKPVKYQEFVDKVKELGKFWFATNILPTSLTPVEEEVG